MRRRDFLALAAATPAAAAPLDLSSRVCLFTDHLAGFSYDEVARMLKDLGVSGPDLTVRRGGLVRPDQVASELPKAQAAFAERGLSIPMITTEITSASDANALPVLEAAAKAKIPHYKLGYTRYTDLSRWRETIVETRTKLQQLAKVNRRLGLRAGMHNHSGDSVGCCVWDNIEILQDVDEAAIGFYFDPAQATIEGGKLGWNLSFRRVMPRLLMVAIKDFIWEKSEEGWRARWVPLGEGMVNWDAAIPLLMTATFPGPISLHIEYDPGGKSKTERYDRALEAAARDLRFLRARLSA
ncbi:MAG: TIM barrel protein [Bryobacteraceae bacterium]